VRRVIFTHFETLRFILARLCYHPLMKLFTMLLGILISAQVWAASTYESDQEEYKKFINSPHYARAAELIEQIQFESFLKGENSSLGSRFIKLLAENRATRSYILHKALNTRCERYNWFFEEPQCSLALWKMIGTLDFDLKIAQAGRDGQGNWRPEGFVFVAFKTKFIRLLNQQNTAHYLESLLSKMIQWKMNPTGVSFNLWDFTLAYAKSTSRAVELISVLFQDTSISQSHLEYIAFEKVTGNQFFNRNVELLSSAIMYMDEIAFESDSQFKQMLYPRSLKTLFNSNPYHFYVPFHLTTLMTKDGFSKRYSIMASTMLTVTYEMITLKDDMSYVYFDPNRLNNTYKVRDIFSGFTGARWGAGHRNIVPSYQSLERAFGKSTKDAMALLIKNMN
jgi:hypothetical protein